MAILRKSCRGTGPSVVIELKTSQLALFSEQDCNVRDGDFEVKASLRFPPVQDKAISLSFSQETGTKVLDDKIPALATVNHVYLWYPI